MSCLLSLFSVFTSYRPTVNPNRTFITLVVVADRRRRKTSKSRKTKLAPLIQQPLPLPDFTTMARYRPPPPPPVDVRLGGIARYDLMPPRGPYGLRRWFWKKG